FVVPAARLPFADGRAGPVHVGRANPKSWVLQLNDAQLRDAGLYKCLLNSDPPVSQVVSLRVVVPKAHIMGGPDLHFEAGYPLNLTCSISESPEAPAFVFWYHQSRLVNFEHGGRVVVAKGRNGSAVSRLPLPAVRAVHSGNCTCDPANANATWVLVHVLESHRRLAAVQKDAGGMALISDGNHVRSSWGSRLACTLSSVNIRSAIMGIRENNVKLLHADKSGRFTVIDDDEFKVKANAAVDKSFMALRKRPSGSLRTN
ncbi:hypothetical protein HPB47_026454, partial [Ixodes persulcatus]